jgi:hypothetical protein
MDHNEYLQRNERNTKTRTGTDVKNKREIPQRAWANVNNQSRCPVKAYKLYKSKRPLRNFNCLERRNIVSHWRQCKKKDGVVEHLQYVFVYELFCTRFFCHYLHEVAQFINRKFNSRECRRYFSETSRKGYIK